MQTRIRYISAEQVCRLVKLFAIYCLAELLQGGNPILVQHGQTPHWRVPVILHSQRGKPQTSNLDLGLGSLQRIMEDTQRTRIACQCAHARTGQ